MRRALHIPVLLAVAAACGTVRPPAKPEDMSAAQHEAEAAAEVRAAQEHERQAAPSVFEERFPCPEQAGRRQYTGTEICWTSVSSPTARQLLEAEEHRRHAASHRAASAELRAAEARACAGVAPDDRDISPFEHPEDIAGVAPLAAPGEPVAGAVVTFHPVPGMTAERLQRILDCHLARNAALGHRVPEKPDCPLVPRGATARVRPVRDGFAVEIRSDEPATAREILERARRLQQRAAERSSVSTE